jgi:hypothetical protein
MDKVETGPSVPNMAVVENVITNATENTTSLLEQIYNNKTYVYIFIVVLVLAGIGIYLYLNQSTSKPKDDKTKENKIVDVKAKAESSEEKNILNPNKDYYLIDPSGKTIFINKYFSKIVQSENQENEMIQEQIRQQQQRIKEQMMTEQMMNQQPMQNQQPMNQQQMNQQPMNQQPMQQSIMVNNQNGLPPPGQNRVIQTQQMPSQRPRLSHPGESNIPDVNLDEDDNIANQDLTQTEIDELKRQLELMQRKQSAPITAENEGNTDAEF